MHGFLTRLPGVRAVVVFLLRRMGIYPVVYYGMVPSSSSAYAASNTTAFQSVWTLCATNGGGVLLFGVGLWALNATTLNHGLDYSSTVSIQGSGGTTLLYFYGTTGPFLNIASTAGSSVNYGFIRDLQFRHNDVVASGATLQLGYVGNYLFENVRSIYNSTDKASTTSVRLHATARALKFVNCKFATRNDITQLSYDGISPIGLDIAVAGGYGYEFHSTEFSGCLGGGAAIADGAVTGVTVSAVGSGYTSAPTVSFSGGGGSGAAGTAVLTNGKVTSVTITNGGSGYTSAPTVSFSGGGGSGAAATITGRGTGIRWINTAIIDTVTFSGLCLIKDWDTGMRFGFGSDNGTVANLMADEIVIDGVTGQSVHYTPSGTAIIANHQYGDAWFSGLAYNFLIDNTGGGTLYGIQINGSYLTGARVRSIIVQGTVSELVFSGNRITCDASVTGTVALEIGDGTNAVEDVAITGNRIAVSGVSPDAVIRINANVDSFTVTGNVLRRGADADGIINTPGTGTSAVVANNAYLA